MNPLLKQRLQEQNAKARYISQLLAASVNTELIKQRLNASRAFNQMINQRSKARYISQLLAASVNTELIKQQLNASRAFNQMINQRSKSTRSKERKEK